MEIRELRRSELDEAAKPLSRGMRDNPDHIAAFGLHVDRRRQVVDGFFRAVLPGLHMRGMILGAFDGAAMLGVCGLAPPSRRQPALSEKIRITRAPSLESQRRHWINFRSPPRRNPARQQGDERQQ